MRNLSILLILVWVPLSTANALASSGSNVLGVETLMKSPDKYPGVVQVEGAVSSVSPQKGILTLIDKSELAECGVANCAEYVLPVQWIGPFPEVKGIVKIKGRVEKVNGKKIFVATSLTKPPSKSKTKVEK